MSRPFLPKKRSPIEARQNDAGRWAEYPRGTGGSRFSVESSRGHGWVLGLRRVAPDHREIIAGWSRFVSGEFILERNLKRGSVFISSEDEQVYMVSGIFSSWEEMIPQADLPILLRATLIPFKDRIIYDSIVTSSNVIIGRGYAEIFKDIYLSAKQAKSIHTSL